MHHFLPLLYVHGVLFCLQYSKTVPHEHKVKVKSDAYKSLAKKKLGVTDEAGEVFFKSIWKFRDDRNLTQHPCLFKKSCREAINCLFTPTKNEFKALTTYLDISGFDEDDSSLDNL